MWIATVVVPAISAHLTHPVLPALTNVLGLAVALLDVLGRAADDVAAPGKLPVSGAPRMILGDAEEAFPYTAPLLQLEGTLAGLV